MKFKQKKKMFVGLFGKKILSSSEYQLVVSKLFRFLQVL